MKKVIFIIFIVFSHNLLALNFVVSDIDDTIKKSYSVDRSYAIKNFIKGGDSAYYGMKLIYDDLYQKGFRFIYLTASYEEYYNAEDWIKKHGFPSGLIIQKNRKSVLSQFKFKHDELIKIFKNIRKEDNVFMFGDNSFQDMNVYEKIKKKFFKNNILTFYRDIRLDKSFAGIDTYSKRYIDVDTFFSEFELLNSPKFYPLRKELRFKTITKIAFPYYRREIFNQFEREFLQKKLMPLYCPKGLNKNCATPLGRRIGDVLNSYYEWF